ncbi:unnamed protein product [Phytophthora fragariaefolia]|uniref:Unnamed protein product n=1 Tax=Phytophthora fragariaefolia TaxID=1490495 RepID=A0A9W7D733_9STRA|nr:unnamed protein product [Phytophthora fragariaefolia]
MGHGDLVGYQNVGCADLLREVEHRIRPKLHVFGHVHEGYGHSTSPDGAITYFNASACTHNYEPVNAPFVFELTGPPKRGWPKHTLPSSSPSSSGLGIRRSFSTNDVSSISSLSTTDDEDVDMDAGLPIRPEPRDYALVLHEWLRLCSHKPPFIEKNIVDLETCEVRKGKLREFRVDGTTSGLLFESTLKIRPVTNVQKRALRYLFSQGFRSNSDNYKPETGEGESAAVEREVCCDMVTSMELGTEPSKSATERRKYGISRRVTVAVLDDIDEDKEGMDDRDCEHVQQARVAAAALGKEQPSETAESRGRRPRRNKTLQRRSAVPMLASLTEEPSDVEENNASAAKKALKQKNIGVGDLDSSEAIVVAPPIVECVLCKYNVAGHIHPGAEPPPTPAPRPTLKEAKKVEARENPDQRSKAENPPPKRLSSWF